LIALDTNILIRYIVQDEPDQARAATTFLEDQLSSQEPGFVSAIVVVEIIWTLRRAYGRSTADIGSVVGRLLSAPQLHLEHRPALEAALREAPDQIPDYLIAAAGRRAGCREVVTLDRRFARVPGVRLLAD
jgi:predicted nucleic-acid-binding protein